MRKSKQKINLSTEKATYLDDVTTYNYRALWPYNIDNLIIRLMIWSDSVWAAKYGNTGYGVLRKGYKIRKVLAKNHL